MLQKIKERIFPFLIALTAISISLSSALFSIIGLSQLFAGIGIAVIVMASSLEISKLVIASILYQYRKTLSKLLQVYLTIALILLMVITSAGSYGYLTQGYSATSNKISIVEQQITSLTTKKQLYENTKKELLVEKQSIDKSTSELRTALSTGTILQSRDKNGNLITKESKNNRKSYEAELQLLSTQNNTISDKINVINDSIFSYEDKILNSKTQLTEKGELGPLKYLSGLTGQPMDKIINWLILTIIFVFDPLAICLVFAANFAFARLKKNPDINQEWKNQDFPNGIPFNNVSLTQSNTSLTNENVINNDVVENDYNAIKAEIDSLRSTLQNNPSLSTRKRWEIETSITELNKQLVDPFYKPLNKVAREY